jgi:hypothetical protein
MQGLYRLTEGGAATTMAGDNSLQGNGTDRQEFTQQSVLMPTPRDYSRSQKFRRFSVLGEAPRS